MGRIDYLTKVEIDRLKEDEELVKVSLQASQVSIANALKNGLGEAMVNELENPPKKKGNKITQWLNKWRKKTY